MAWISVHDSIIGGKLRELAKQIGCTQEEALGILVSLWLWGLRNADKDGRLISADKGDVLEAFSVRLNNSLKVNVVDALLKTSWIDEPEPGVLYIHDWDQWQEQWYKAMERREKDAKRKAESRSEKRVRDTDPHDHAKQTEQNTDGSAENTAISPVVPKYVPAFETFWKAYPRHEGKGEAYKKYKARRNDGYSDEELLKAAQNYAAACKKKKTEPEYIKHPKTFLSESLPFLDYLPKKTPMEEMVYQSQNPFDEWRDET